MERTEVIKLRVKALLNESAANGDRAKKPRWMEAAFITVGAALILQAIALTTVMDARAPIYLGMDPYGNHVATNPNRPLAGKIYADMNYTPGTKVIPTQDELKQRTALEFRF